MKPIILEELLKLSGKLRIEKDYNRNMEQVQKYEGQEYRKKTIKVT